MIAPPTRVAAPLAEPLFLAFLLCLLLIPWPLGSNRDWLWPVFTATFALIALARVWRRTPLDIPVVPAAAFVALLAWLSLQAFGIPGVLEPISVDPYLTTGYLLRAATLATVFFLVINLTRTPSHLAMLLMFMTAAGVVQAVAGIVQVSEHAFPDPSGSFASPNHYAASLYFSLFTALSLGGWYRTRLLMFLVAMAAASLLLMLLLSGSRMGIAATIAAAAGVAVLVPLASRWSVTGTVVLTGFSVLAVLAAIVVTSLNAGEALSSSIPRIELVRSSLALISDYGLTGAGGGTFQLAFAAYRTPEIFDTVIHADNDYLQLVAELGVPGVLALTTLLLAALLRQFGGAVAAGRERWIHIGMLGATLAMLGHAFTDANLQVPANATWFVVILAIPFTRPAG